jgi:hypothetical protein
VRKIFFVVNKIDLLGDRERHELLEFVANTIREHMSTDAVRIFPLSCKLGVAAKASGDSPAYARSGLKALEEELGRFLADEKSATFLAAIVDRALRLADAEASEVDLAKHVQELPPSTLQQRLDDVQRQWQGQAALRRDIFQKLRQHALSELQIVLSRQIESFLATERASISPRIQRLLHHVSWQPCALVSRRITDGELRHLRSKVSRWLAARAEQLTFASDDVCRGLWAHLQHNLGEIPDLASAALGLGPSDHPSAEGLPPWRLQAKLEPPVSADVRW